MIELCSEYLFVQCIWLYALLMLHMHFRVDPYSIVTWMSRKSLLKKRSKIWGLSDCNWTPPQNHLVCNWTLNHLAKLANDWAVFWVLICAVHLTVCSCHATYTFQSGSTLYSCLNVKEIPAQSTSKIWGLSDCNWTWTQNYLVCKVTLNHLARLASDWVVFWVLTCTVHLTVCSCHVTYAFQSGFTLCSCLVKELCSKQVRNLRVKWLQLDLNP